MGPDSLPPPPFWSAWNVNFNLYQVLPLCVAHGKQQINNSDWLCPLGHHFAALFTCWTSQLGQTKSRSLMSNLRPAHLCTDAYLHSVALSFPFLLFSPYGTAPATYMCYRNTTADLQVQRSKQEIFIDRQKSNMTEPFLLYFPQIQQKIVMQV